MKIIHGIVSSINAGIAVKLYLELTKKGIHPVLCIVSSVTMAVLFSKILEYMLFDFPKLFYLFRRLSLPEASFEGVWILKINADKNLVEEVFYHYAIANIFYSKADGKYHYEGKAYDEKCEIKGDWYSTSLSTDASTSTIRYFYDGKIYTDGIEKVEGVGMLKFDPGVHGGFNEATDYLIEINKDMGRYSCFSKKISSKNLKQYKSKSGIDHRKMINDYEDF